MVRMIWVVLCLALIASGAGSASAAMAYDTQLAPENVYPDSPPIGYAWGWATAIVDDAGVHCNLTLNFAGLEAPQTAARLLRAAPGEVGTVLVDLPLGSFLAVSLPYTADLADAIENGELAIQIHSQDWPGGAIRGNFRFVTVEVDAATWSAVKKLFD